MAEKNVDFNTLHYPQAATTSEPADTKQDRPGPPMPARAFIFWIIEEINPDGILVRSIYADPQAAASQLGQEVFKIKPDQMKFEMYPEQHGLRVRGPVAVTTLLQLQSML